MKGTLIAAVLLVPGIAMAQVAKTDPKDADGTDVQPVISGSAEMTEGDPSVENEVDPAAGDAASSVQVGQGFEGEEDGAKEADDIANRTVAPSPAGDTAADMDQYETGVQTDAKDADGEVEERTLTDG